MLRFSPTAQPAIALLLFSHFAVVPLCTCQTTRGAQSAPQIPNEEGKKEQNGNHRKKMYQDEAAERGGLECIVSLQESHNIVSKSAPLNLSQ